jgi:hypothetical protein
MFAVFTTSAQGISELLTVEKYSLADNAITFDLRDGSASTSADLHALQNDPVISIAVTLADGSVTRVYHFWQAGKMYLLGASGSTDINDEADIVQVNNGIVKEHTQIEVMAGATMTVADVIQQAKDRAIAAAATIKTAQQATADATPPEDAAVVVPPVTEAAPTVVTKVVEPEEAEKPEAGEAPEVEAPEVAADEAAAPVDDDEPPVEKASTPEVEENPIATAATDTLATQAPILESPNTITGYAPVADTPAAVSTPINPNPASSAVEEQATTTPETAQPVFDDNSISEKAN